MVAVGFEFMNRHKTKVKKKKNGMRDPLNRLLQHYQTKLLLLPSFQNLMMQNWTQKWLYDSVHRSNQPLIQTTIPQNLSPVSSNWFILY